MDKVEELLKALAKSLGIAVEKLIEWYSAKAVVEGASDLLTAALLLTVAVVAGFWFRKLMKAEVVTDVDVDGPLAVLAAITTVAGFVFGLMFLRYGIIEFYAPQAYAVEQIIKAIKQ